MNEEQALAWLSKGKAGTLPERSLLLPKIQETRR